MTTQNDWCRVDTDDGIAFIRVSEIVLVQPVSEDRENETSIVLRNGYEIVTHECDVGGFAEYVLGFPVEDRAEDD